MSLDWQAVQSCSKAKDQGLMHKALQGPGMQMDLKYREAHRLFRSDAGGDVEAVQVKLSRIQMRMMQLCKV